MRLPARDGKNKLNRLLTHPLTNTKRYGKENDYRPFESSVKRFPGNPFLWEKTGKRFEPTTYSKVRDLVYEEGAGLVSLGVRKGDNMALLSEGRNAWIIGELAMFYAGATNVPLSIKLEEANDLLFRLVHADVKYIMVSGQQLREDPGDQGSAPRRTEDHRTRRAGGIPRP